MTKSKERCPTCKKSLHNCSCEYDFIFNISEFVKRRSIAIHEQKQKEFAVLGNIVILINYIFENLPRFYVTRSGCEVEEFDMSYHSDHDAVRNIGAMMVSLYNELIVDLSVGSFSSAISCTRCIFEWLIRTVAAVSDRSILTGLPGDKNKAVCFAGLMKMKQFERWKKVMTHEDKGKIKNFIKEANKIESENPEITRIINRHLGVIKSEIPSGIGNIPKKLNVLILKSIIIHNPYGEEFLTGSKALYKYYEIVSEHVHKDIENLYKEPGGANPFIDFKEFDESFSQIILMSDLILYFFFLLIDLDIFHRPEDKHNWRMKSKKMFKEVRLDLNLFKSTSTLLNSVEWNSIPPTNYAYLPANIQMRSDKN